MPRRLLQLLILLAFTLSPFHPITLSLRLAAAAAESAPGTAPASQPAAVQITGTIKFTGKLLRIAAIDREWADVLKTSEANPRDASLYDGQFDAKTGAFTIAHLLPGRTYDLVIWTESPDHEKIRWEGANMDYHRAILPDQAMSPEDQKWLEEFARNMPSFYDKARVLHLGGDHKHATMLVELARTRDFHSQKNGEIIYRVELWYFENLFGGWAKDKNTEKVLARVRTPGDKLEKYWQFLPQLGGIVPAAAPIAISLPEKPVEQNGLAGKTP